jgi:hypothetical protein
LGQAQTDRILTPAVTGSAALVEIADLAVAQQGTKADGKKLGIFLGKLEKNIDKPRSFRGKLERN